LGDGGDAGGFVGYWSRWMRERKRKRVTVGVKKVGVQAVGLQDEEDVEEDRWEIE
jgi:hypothetical protein